MSLRNRKSLRNFFKTGSFPTEKSFYDLIDSTVNKVDDGFNKDIKNGLMLSPLGTSKKLLSLYDKIRDKLPSWYFELNSENRSKGLNLCNQEETSCLFVAENTNVGIGTTIPKHKLEVNGAVAMSTRLGNYRVGEVEADGKWHPILENLDGSNMFEVVAQVSGKERFGRYAMLHAIALSTFGSRRRSIRKTRTHWGFFWNKLNIRWKTIDNHNYQLQLRTWSDYGVGEDNKQRKIQFRITKLWDMNDEQKLDYSEKKEEEIAQIPAKA